MAIKSNDSSKQVTRERVNYTGPALVTVVAANPTLAELQALGINMDKEPEYISTSDEGIQKVRIDFYVNSTDGALKSKVVFFLENKERSNKEGTKFEFINNAGQNTWAESLEEAVNKEAKNGKKFFSPEGARVALVGEVDFYNFIKCWANVEPGEECKLEDISALFKGNFKELQSLVKMLAKNSLWVMATVNEKGYQNVYNRLFARATSKQFAAAFKKHADDQKKQGYPVKDSWGVEFKEYVPLVVVADNEPDNAPVAATADIF